MVSLDGAWWLALDPANAGRELGWFRTPPAAQARPATVPGIIQQVFPGCHGVVWYWRRFKLHPLPEPGGRVLLRFGAVDYLADVRVNGVWVGGHEGGETPFALDVTDVVSREGENLVVVRVLTIEPIDGITLGQTPHRNKIVPYKTGYDLNHGGITQGVELYTVPPVRLDDVWVRPDPATGLLRLRVTVRNDTPGGAHGEVRLAVAPAAGGRAQATRTVSGRWDAGSAVLEADLSLLSPRLWSVDDPYLYRVTAQLAVETDDGKPWQDECSVRCGFRDFRFADGHFRLNGRRIFLRSAHTGNDFPIGLCVPHDRELLRRDLYYAKSMGFNTVRFIAGMAHPEQLDLCDELGLMVYEECYAAWLLEDSPYLVERFDRCTGEMVLRDRNHPCVTVWGLLNETCDGPVFRHAVEALALVRRLDPTRLVLLNSGRWDGRFSNPGSPVWECLLGADGTDSALQGPGDRGYVAGAGDAHAYPPIPLSAASVHFLRQLGQDTKPVFLSEHGNGAEVDAPRLVGLYQQAGACEDLEDYALYRHEAERFLADWARFRMDALFACPSDWMRASQQQQAQLRRVALDAVRSNPRLVGYSITGLVDQGRTAEGLWTTFRELKPGMMEAIREGWEPLRWCIFAEPPHAYLGRTVTIEVVLANEDVLRPGEYPVRLRVRGPDGIVAERATILEVGEDATAPLALPVFREEIRPAGGAGRYEVEVGFERGAAPAGGRANFYVADAAALPRLTGRVVLVGDEERLGPWLEGRGLRWSRLGDPQASACQVILVGGLTGPPGDEAVFAELERRIREGSLALFLAPKGLAKGGDPLGWLPLARKGTLRWTRGWAAGRDDFAHAHPIFDGLPTGMLDPTYYRDLIADETFDGQEEPDEVVAGGFAVGSYHPGGYAAGLTIAVFRCGAGRLIMNALPILEHLEMHPAADRLLANMIDYASRAWTQQE